MALEADTGRVQWPRRGRLQCSPRFQHSCLTKTACLPLYCREVLLLLLVFSAHPRLLHNARCDDFGAAAACWLPLKPSVQVPPSVDSSQTATLPPPSCSSAGIAAVNMTPSVPLSNVLCSFFFGEAAVARWDDLQG